MSYQTVIGCEALSKGMNENWRIIDCRFSLSDVTRGRRAYLESHIPGAIYAHLDEDLSGPIVPKVTGRHPWPSVQATTALFSSWGIDAQTQVVAYDDAGGAIAARLWWMLRWLGHDRAAVLDGGFQAWQGAGLPLDSGEQEPAAPKAFQPNPRPELITGADRVETIRQDSNYVLIDARGAKRFRGEEEPIDPVAGHIPGARNCPFPENLNENGFFKSPNALAARFHQSLEERPAEKAIVYCGSGVTAAHNLLAMRHAGLGDGCLYTESWSGWIALGNRPVATGE